MKKIAVILFFVLFLTILNAYDWSQFGLDSGVITNFCFQDDPACLEMICTLDGFYTYETDMWVLHSYSDLPVWDLSADDDGEADLIVVLGDGSYSDGIYSYTFDIDEFSIRYWFVQPSFLVQDAVTGIYYVGGTSGLVRSEDGINWQEVTEFNGMSCYAMAMYGSNYVVSANDYDIFYSSDSGENWDSSESYLLISDLCFDTNGKLYGIFPETSWSSGLWSSNDYGASWQLEFWEIMLNSVFTDLDDKVFVGWKDGTSNQGLAQWDTVEEELYFYNNGLLDLNINKITTHPFVDCINIICCTNNGSYMLTDYQITSTGEDLPGREDHLTIYPNPFNPETVISFKMSGISDQDVELAIYNVKGQVIKKYRSLSDSNSIIWNGKDNKGEPVASGIYYARISAEGRMLQKKMLLLK